MITQQQKIHLPETPQPKQEISTPEKFIDRNLFPSIRESKVSFQKTPVQSVASDLSYFSQFNKGSVSRLSLWDSQPLKESLELNPLPYRSPLSQSRVNMSSFSMIQQKPKDLGATFSWPEPKLTPGQLQTYRDFQTFRTDRESLHVTPLNDFQELLSQEQQQLTDRIAKLEKQTQQLLNPASFQTNLTSVQHNPSYQTQNSSFQGLGSHMSRVLEPSFLEESRHPFMSEYKFPSFIKESQKLGVLQQSRSHDNIYRREEISRPEIPSFLQDSKANENLYKKQEFRKSEFPSFLQDSRANENLYRREEIRRAEIPSFIEDTLVLQRPRESLKYVQKRPLEEFRISSKPPAYPSTRQISYQSRRKSSHRNSCSERQTYRHSCCCRRRNSRRHKKQRSTNKLIQVQAPPVFVDQGTSPANSLQNSKRQAQTTSKFSFTPRKEQKLLAYSQSELPSELKPIEEISVYSSHQYSNTPKKAASDILLYAYTPPRPILRNEANETIIQSLPERSTQFYLLAQLLILQKRTLLRANKTFTYSLHKNIVGCQREYQEDSKAKLMFFSGNVEQSNTVFRSSEGFSVLRKDVSFTENLPSQWSYQALLALVIDDDPKNISAIPVYLLEFRQQINGICVPVLWKTV